MKKVNGGPAFPVSYGPDGRPGFDPGMSLRDWFAAHAPEADGSWIESQYQIDRSRNPHNEPHKPAIRSELELRAAWRFRYADAMLVEREKEVSA